MRRDHPSPSTRKRQATKGNVSPTLRRAARSDDKRHGSTRARRGGGIAWHAGVGYVRRGCERRLVGGMVVAGKRSAPRLAHPKAAGGYFLTYWVHVIVLWSATENGGRRGQCLCLPRHGAAFPRTIGWGGPTLERAIRVGDTGPALLLRFDSIPPRR